MSEYDKLFSKYNSVVARNQDLMQQMETKSEQWDKREEEFRVMEKNIRDLCEKILATNRDEMRLGNAKSWSEMSMREILEHTNAAYAKYRDEQSAIFKMLTDQLEERRKVIESKDAEINRLLVEGNKFVDEEQLKAAIDKEEQEKKYRESIPPDQKNDPKIKRAREEDEDAATIDENDIYGDIDDINNEAIKPTHYSVPLTQTKRNVEIKKKRRQEAEKAHNLSEVEEAEKRVPNDTAWMAIAVLGSTGLSALPDLQLEMIKHDKTLTINAIRTVFVMLDNIGLAHRAAVTNPIRKRFILYEFTPLGALVYKHKYAKNPTPSEMGRIIAEHNNLDHGYGIKAVADKFRENGLFKSVNEYNRKTPIKLKNGTQYIPDILCTDNNGKRYYFEYECGNTDKNDFRGKCGKMANVTDTLNFIGPNKETVEGLAEQVKDWIKNRGPKALDGIKVRINSAQNVTAKGTDIRKDSAWMFVFLPAKKGEEPYKNF